MYFLKKLLKQKAYCLIGRGGMLFFDGKKEYYLDTENYTRNTNSKDKFGVVIFFRAIRLKKQDIDLEESKKMNVAVEVQSLLATDKIIATIE